MCLRGRRIGWHALNARFEFFNFPPTRISPLSSKKGGSDKILLEFTILFLIFAIEYSLLHILQIQFKAVDFSGDMKSDTACSRCALDNFKQYTTMRHILFKLEYLFSKSSTMQGWEAATRIFLCFSERSLSKRVKTLGGQCFSTHIKNSIPLPLSIDQITGI